MFSSCGCLILYMSIRSCLLNIQFELPEICRFLPFWPITNWMCIKISLWGGFVPLTLLSLSPMVFLSQNLLYLIIVNHKLSFFCLLTYLLPSLTFNISVSMFVFLANIIWLAFVYSDKLFSLQVQTIYIFCFLGVFFFLRPTWTSAKELIRLLSIPFSIISIYFFLLWIFPPEHF